MRFPRPLLRGTLVRRYKRFLADVQLETGEVVTAHCPNSGSMRTVSDPGCEVWLSAAEPSGRTLSFTWELIRIDGELVGINTNRPNQLVMEAVLHGRIPKLSGYPSPRREVRYGRNSRIDLLLQSASGPTCLVEVKNVTMKRGKGYASPVEFPDCVTDRGAKHLAELTAAVGRGERAVVVYVTQRADAEQMTVAADLDPTYADAAQTAASAGVESLCYRCHVDPEEVRLTDPVPVVLPGGMAEVAASDPQA